MRYEKLSKLLDISMGRTPSRSEPNYWGKGHKWVSIRDLNSKIITDTKEQITDLAVKEARCKLVPNGTLLFSFKLTIGKMAFAGCDLYTNEAIAAFSIKDNKKLNSEFLYYALLSANFGGSNQAAMGKTLNSKSLADIEIPLPPLQDQIRIAYLLGTVESLISQRKQHLQQLDELLKSVFLEMFGDPIKNPHKFPLRQLSEFYVNPKEGTKCGPFGSALKKEELVDSGVPVWNMDNISTDGQMISPFRMWITYEKYDELSSYSVRDGDIVISRAGTVGKMCVARMNGQPAIISTNLIRLRLSADLRPLHFVSLMLYCKGRVGRLKTGADGTFTHMNTGVLDSLEFPYPPVTLQDQFGKIAAKVENIKSQYQQSLVDLESLYGALSQKAFNSELDLSNVPLIHEVQTEIREESFLNRQQDALEDLSVNEYVNIINLINQVSINPPSSLIDKQCNVDAWLDAYIQYVKNNKKQLDIKLFIQVCSEKWNEKYQFSGAGIASNLYDKIKESLFEKLRNTELLQEYDEENVAVKLRLATQGN